MREQGDRTMSGISAGRASRGPWRAQATIKLVGRRREALATLAEREAPGCSPVDAIDRAIDLALAARGEMDSLQGRLDAMEDTLEAIDHARRAEAARIEAGMARLAASVERLHALISEVAESSEL